VRGPSDDQQVNTSKVLGRHPIHRHDGNLEMQTEPATYCLGNLTGISEH
jgi:hypothetical protein